MEKENEALKSEVGSMRNEIEDNSMIISRQLVNILEILTLAVILFGRKNVLLMAFMTTLV